MADTPTETTADTTRKTTAGTTTETAMKTSMTTTKPITEAQKAVNRTTMAGSENALQRGRSGMLVTPPQ